MHRPPDSLVDRINNKLVEIRGNVEGNVIAGRMSKKASQRFLAFLAIVLGKATPDVPAYVSSLRETTFSEFCSVNADLEHTAVLGYQRMMALCEVIPGFELMTDTTLEIDVRRTGKDEKYHEALFRKLANWPPLPPSGTPPAANPLGPAAAGVEGMSVDWVRGMIAEAKDFAYGNEADVFGDTVITFDEDLLYNDPIIQNLREFARREPEGGEKTMYMRTGM